MDNRFLIVGPHDAETTILLAHGAGAPMDSRPMNAAAAALAEAGFRVARFEFDYMALRRMTGSRKPPPNAGRLQPEYLAAVDALSFKGRLIIGGKSMGGRVASMVAGELFKAGRASGLLCLGYPFHPPAKPGQLRTGHLETIDVPAMIIQGTRDAFGTKPEVDTYTLSPSISFVWLEDGDHDLKPRKSVSGFSAADHLKTMASEVLNWAAALA